MNTCSHEKRTSAEVVDLTLKQNIPENIPKLSPSLSRWTVVGQAVLIEEDKSDLVSGKWLNDRHIKVLGIELVGPGDKLEGPGDEFEGPGGELEGPGEELEGPREELEGPADGPEDGGFGVDISSE